MKTTLSICFLTIVFLFPTRAQILEEVLEKHRLAVGANAQNVRSLLLDVKELSNHGTERKYTIVKKRPEKIRIDGMWEGKSYTSACDGNRAWTIAPWTGTSMPQLMTEREKEELMLNAHIDSPLLFQEGYDKSLQVVTDNQVLEAGFITIRMIQPSGKWVDFYLSEETYLINKYVEYENNDVTNIEKEVFFKQYKTQAGITMPMAYEHRMKNSMLDVWVTDIMIGFGAQSNFFKKPE